MMSRRRRRPTTAPRTVLFVQRYPDGGSITSLFDLVVALDPERYRPLVSFRVPTAFVEEFRQAGIECVVLEGDGAAEPPSPSTSTSPPTPAAVPRPGRSSPWRRELRRLVKRDLPAARRLVRLVRERDVAVVHANTDVRSDRDAVLAAWATRRPCVSMVRWINEYAPDAGLRIDRFLARRTDRFVHMSEAIRAGMAPLGIDPAHEVVLDDTFDLEPYGQPEPAGLRAGLGVPADARLVVNVGRIVPWKGQDLFLSAMAEVMAERADVIAVVVGSATDEAGEAFQGELDALAVELGIAERVVFAGRRRDVPQLLAAASVFVHSATQPEPFGRVVVEAMASSLPLVAVGAGGIPEFVDDGRTGLLVPMGEVGPMAEAIADLLDDPDKAAELGWAARVVAEGRFDRASLGQAVQAMYDDLLGLLPLRGPSS